MHPILFSLKRRYNKEKLPDPFAYLYKWFSRVPRGVFQVGASSGQEIKGFITRGIKKGVFVEPLPDAYHKLRQATASQPGYLAVNGVCADAANRVCNFYVSERGGIASSLLKPTGVLTIHPELGFGSSPITLESTTVDQIAADLRARGHSNIIDSIDLLYLDTQGAELSVLKGATGLLAQALYVFTEVSRGGLYENEATYSELTEYLETRDFSLAFLYLNKHGWGDALYVHASVFDQ